MTIPSSFQDRAALAASSSLMRSMMGNIIMNSPTAIGIETNPIFTLSTCGPRPGKSFPSPSPMPMQRNIQMNR